jgi:diguanylate cyclase (GGDEF)-like protein/PAS domain S-box-containing protein
MDHSNPPPFANVLDLLLDAVCVVDAEGRFLFVSAAFERIFGYAPQEIVGTPMLDLVLPEDRERTLEAAARIMAGQPQPHFENRYVRKDGRVVDIMWSARWSESDQARVAVARDVTQLKRAHSIQAALLDISEAAHTAEDLMDLFPRIHRIIDSLLPARNFFVALRDQERDELSFPYFVDELDPPPAPRPMDSGTLSGEVIRSGKALLLSRDAGSPVSESVATLIGSDPLDWLGVPLRAAKGVIGALVVQSYSGDVRYTARDTALLQFVSAQVAAAIERKQAQAWLQHSAQHDPLTGLPNRALALERLENALHRARRHGDAHALLYLDLDGFKQVNDSLGHPVGDLLLQQAAQRLKACVRDTDTVGRMGGDEFVVLLHDIRSPADATTVAAKILAAFAEPFALEDRLLQVSGSIGVVTCPEHGHDGGRLVQQADRAMYAAKKSGGNRMRVAAPGPA